MTTTVINGQDYSGGISSTSTNYFTARAGGTIAAPATPYVGQVKSGSNYICSQQVMYFDTSVLSGQVIESVTLEWYIAIDLSTTDFLFEVRTLSGLASPLVDNWVPGASLGGQTLVASINTSTFSGGYRFYTLTSEIAFTSALNLSGDTVVIASSSRQRLGNSPTGNEFVYTRILLSGSYTDPPILTVVHSDPAPDPVTGTAASSLRPLTSAASGGQSQSGAMVSALQPLSASAAGYEHAQGAIAASLRPLTADLNDRLDNTIVSALAPLTAALSGTQSQSGTIAASLQPLSLSITGAYLGIIQTTVRPGWSGGAPGPLRPRRGSARR